MGFWEDMEELGGDAERDDEGEAWREPYRPDAGARDRVYAAIDTRLGSDFGNAARRELVDLVEELFVWAADEYRARPHGSFEAFVVWIFFGRALPRFVKKHTRAALDRELDDQHRRAEALAGGSGGLVPFITYWNTRLIGIQVAEPAKWHVPEHDDIDTRHSLLCELLAELKRGGHGIAALEKVACEATYRWLGRTKDRMRAGRGGRFDSEWHRGSRDWVQRVARTPEDLVAEQQAIAVLRRRLAVVTKKLGQPAQKWLAMIEEVVDASDAGDTIKPACFARHASRDPSSARHMVRRLARELERAGLHLFLGDDPDGIGLAPARGAS